MEHRSPKQVCFQDYYTCFVLFIAVTTVSAYTSEQPCFLDNNTCTCQNNTCTCQECVPKLPPCPCPPEPCPEVINLTACGETNHSISACWSQPNKTYNGYSAICSIGLNVTRYKYIAPNGTMFTCTNQPSPGENYTIELTILKYSSLKKKSEPCIVTITAPTSKPDSCKYFCGMCPIIQWMLVSLLCSNALGWICVALIYNCKSMSRVKTDPSTYIKNSPVDQDTTTFDHRDSHNDSTSEGSNATKEKTTEDNQPDTSM